MILIGRCTNLWSKCSFMLYRMTCLFIRVRTERKILAKECPKMLVWPKFGIIEVSSFEAESSYL